MRLLIIGAGPGGYETAVEGAKQGMEVTLISEGPLGGTCLNEGCIPTKTFCHYAELAESSRKAGFEASLDFGSMVSRKEEVVTRLRSGIESLLRNVTVVCGKASFKDDRTVVCNGTEYTADRIIIATGSVSSTLPVPGADSTLTSREMLNLTIIPERLCVIGGGVIGLEFASIFRSFGSEVTVLEFCPEILPRFDDDMAKRLRQSLSRRGITVETQAQVTTIDGHMVTYVKKGKQLSTEADRVLMAVGRKPLTEGLNLEAAGIEYTGKGIKIDSNCQTSVPGIYAIGDVTGGMMLAHVAVFQGRRALNHIEGRKDSIRYDLVPAAVFTIPEAAAVGLTEKECRERGIDIKCLKSFYRANGKAVSMDETDGYCKIITSAVSGEILGCHLMGAHSSDLVHEMAVAMKCGLKTDGMRDVIHAHPSLSEVLQSAFHQ
ncbi:MAG: dihydrolipoyl dehydrogenase [Bacteroidaceae bacterium]|nr:dihydrolipoyl dehydrogenase [Bacteroidaceae bacterium]